MKVHILILNYNGAELLKRYLPSFLAAVDHSSHSCRLSVIDNASSDSSREIVSRLEGKVAWIPLRENRVLCSYNEVARDLDDEVLIFMNNDIEVDKAFIDPLVAPFLEHSDVFMTAPKCLSLKDGSYEGGKTKGEIRFGVFWAKSTPKDYDKPGLTLMSGFGAFDRKKFLDLGGYDELYLPGRLEDADICFRAYQRGWRCYYVPSSMVYHEGGVSFMKSFGPKGTLVINWRNTFLFMWKNLEDWTNFVTFILWLPFRIIYALLTGKAEFVQGLWRAMPLFARARQRRCLTSKGVGKPKYSDRDIFSLSVSTL